MEKSCYDFTKISACFLALLCCVVLAVGCASCSALALTAGHGNGTITITQEQPTTNSVAVDTLRISKKF